MNQEDFESLRGVERIPLARRDPWIMVQGDMNLQEAVDLAVRENKRVEFECSRSRAEMMSDLKDRKGCAITKPSREATTVSVWPPTESTVLHRPEGTQILPTCWEVWPSTRNG